MQTNTVSPLLAAIFKNVDNGTGNCITNPLSWPCDAEYGVEYKLKDRQFSSVNHGTSTAYFSSKEALDRFFEDKAEWIRGTDYDFSMSYSLYEWDWGPVFKDSGSM